MIAVSDRELIDLPDSNVNLNGLNRRISNISSLQSSWTWSTAQVATGSVFNVAYDLFLGPTTRSEDHTVEVMVWTGSFG